MDSRYPPPGQSGNAGSNPNSGSSKPFQLSADAPVFVPRSFQPQPHVYQHQAIAPVSQYTFEGNAVARLRQAIRILTNSPASFDDIMHPLTNSLHQVISEEATLIQIVEELFRQCTDESNFRYTGARICNYFSHNLHTEFPGGKFREHLLKRCELEHQQRDNMAASTPQNQERLIGYTMFMGELLLNMTVGNQKLTVLAYAVCDLLTCLLTMRQDAGLKCVVQVLKLTGSSLEETERNRDPEKKTPRLDSIFDKIKQLTVDDSMRKNLKAMFLSVIELRASEWGQKDKPASTSSMNGSVQPEYPQNGQVPHSSYVAEQGSLQEFQQQPVFYDENGVPYNMIDQGFVPDEYYEYWASGDDYFDDYYYGEGGGYATVDEEFDDEVAAAFEQFMLETNQQ